MAINMNKSEMQFVMLAIASYFFVGIVSSVVALVTLIALGVFVAYKLVKDDINQPKRYFLTTSSVLLLPLIKLSYCRVAEICGFIEGALLYIFIIVYIILLILFGIVKGAIKIKNKT